MSAKVDVIYDGRCSFCLRSLRVVRTLDVRDVLRFHDASDRDAVIQRFPILAEADLDEAIYAVDDCGRSYRGFDAFRRIARTSPLQWPLIPLLYLPGARIVGDRIYAVIARNRQRLGCRFDDGRAGRNA
jgi:predicted DCC family thiol-disulfide oxidoreductase YuxK